MRFHPPSLTSPWRGRPDNLDGLLTAFFQSEMPRSWPIPEPSVDQSPLSFPAPKPAGRPLWRSRFALAASVALLLGGLGMLQGTFPEVLTPSAGTSVTDGGATTGDEVRSHRTRIELNFDPKSGQTGIRIDVIETPKPAKKAAASQLDEMLP